MNVRTPLAATLLTLLLVAAVPAYAGLEAVSGHGGTAIVPTTDSADVAYSLANGFPIWYQDDENGLKLQLCLDQAVEKKAGGIFRPCFTGEPLAGSPISFPNNFGAEAFWWAANASKVFTSRDGVNLVSGDMLFVAGLEAAFATNLGAQDGDQVAFSRIRLRISVPRPGIYRVSHPYGTYDYTITDPGRRAINQTQDVGNFLFPGPPPAGDFTLALQDGPTPPAGFDPFVNAGVVNADGRSIGPFLLESDAPGGDPVFVEAVNGELYLSDPGAGVIHLEVPVTGSPLDQNFFRLELLSLLELDGLDLVEVDPALRGFFLNADDNTQIVEVDRFQLMGKIFNDGPNEKPVANDDLVVTARGRTARIDVLANDEDVVGASNVHGINPQALGLPLNPLDPGGEIVLTEPMETEAGGTVQRSTNIATGKTVFIYTPPSPAFTGEDSFHYVVQDTGGLISDPALVTVIVEDLQAQRAEFRPRLGKWRIEGTSSRIDGNAVELLAGPVAKMRGEAVAPTPVVSEALGHAALALGDGSIGFVLSVDPLPATAIIFATIHIAAPGQPTGPAVFFLFDDILDGAFTGTFSGTATHIIARPNVGVNTFADAVSAIIEGRAYLNIYTLAHSSGGGELRGEVEIPLIGTANVDQTGTWLFDGKSTASPGNFRQVNIRSIGGVTVLGAPLQLR